MNSGLYALAGASATATAAACANRLDLPMTKLSNVYFGLSRVSLRDAEAVSRGSSRGARPIGEATGMDGAAAAGALTDWIGIGTVRCASARSGFTTTRKVDAAFSAPWST